MWQIFSSRVKGKGSGAECRKRKREAEKNAHMSSKLMASFLKKKSRMQLKVYALQILLHTPLDVL